MDGEVFAKPALELFLVAEAEIDGHDGGYVQELVELDLFKVFGRVVPYHGHLEGLDELQRLGAGHDHAVREHLHQLVGQVALEVREVGRGDGHDG